jgi:hypothetical protein
MSIAYSDLGKTHHLSNTLVMQESGLLRYSTLTVGRGRSLYLVTPFYSAKIIV